MRVTGLLVLLALSAQAEPIHALGQPTPKAIKAALDGLEFQAGDNHYSFEAKGRVSASGPFGASGKGRYTVTGDSVSASGDGTMACMGDDCDGTPISWSFSIDFVVLAAGEASLLIRIENDSSTMIRSSDSPQLVGGAESVEREVLVHLVPGAKDERLFAAASKLINQWSDESAAQHLFIHGPRAANPRTVSEVFFGPKSEAAAKTVAKKLEPVLGPITVKPWPGKTPFQVVVVIGDTKAK